MAVSFHWSWDDYLSTPEDVLDRLVEHLAKRAEQ
jgi:hypothetical protein